MKMKGIGGQLWPCVLLCIETACQNETVKALKGQRYRSIFFDFRQEDYMVKKLILPGVMPGMTQRAVSVVCPFLRVLHVRGHAKMRLIKSANTCLILAAHSGDAAMVRLLLKHGANKSIKSKDGEDAASLAQKGHYNEALRLLR